ncbi:helicase [Paenibacillus selenitireducens]|uniref:Helicase n=1 Tax=Paenibacillus selenitireducens TaxID=1324314 RepID=A0A1T2X8C1_9BACL|nr:PH domain-containing protein [Paenibacillus selenitireducens]OPA76139.1 helicase [Paenibacillus selenitireducens]
MGFLDGLMGNAASVSEKDVQQELQPILFQGETVDKAYKLIRDMFVFTNKRLILVDKQGVTGKKVEYQSIPYKSISRFSIETAGTFDLDAELKIWISSAVEPTITKQFKKDSNVYEVQSLLAEKVL